MACEETRELAAEFALGIADGADRARTLRHLADCPECRRSVEELSTVVDQLLLLAPQHEPPAGFESRVVSRIATPRPARRRRRLVLVPVAAAVASAAIAVGVVLGLTSDDRRLADQYRETLAAANGRSFEAARLQDDDGRRTGLVYGYRGSPSWIYVDLYSDRATDYRAELVLTTGRRLPLPTLRLDPTTGSAGQAIPVDLEQVARVELIGSRAGDVLTATLPGEHRP
jgi:putative zinc finger protein